MRRSEILEYTVPSDVENYVNNVYTGVPTYSTLARAVDRGYRDGGRRGAEYVASVLADRLSEAEVLVRINNRAVFVSSAREDNEPTVTVIEDLPNLGGRLLELAEKILLPQYFVDRWYKEEDEQSIYYQAALAQKNMQREASVEVGALTVADDQPAAAVTVTTPVASSNITSSPLPPRAADTPLIRFSRSNQGGIANNPEEKEAILELQQFLNNKLGLDVGRNGPDSKYGPRTTQAVRSFQSLANTVDGIDIKVDGDAGSETINALVAIQSDLETIDRLTKELKGNRLTDSFAKIQYKSSIAKLLEKTLFEDTRSDLENLIAKYNKLINSSDLPSESPIRKTIEDAEAAIIGQDTTNALARSIGNTAATDNGVQGPYQEDDEITNELQGKMEQAGITNLGMVGETITQEDAIALNRAWQDGAIDGPNGEMADAAAVEPAVEPVATDAVQYSNDLTDNLRIYVSRTSRGVDDTQNFLDSILPQDMTNEQRAQARSILQPMVLKLARGDIVFRIDGVDVQGLASTREVTAPSADLVRNFIRNELKDVVAAPVRSAAATAPNAANTAKTLYNLLNGYTNAAEERQITQILRGISSREEYIQINREFKKLSRTKESIIEWLQTEMWTTTPITQHLNSLGVNLNDSIEHTLARLNTVLGVKQ
jgi:peptidoglycan hydrolase-like protein with peptidoglycan-binding domain